MVYFANLCVKPPEADKSAESLVRPGSAYCDRINWINWIEKGEIEDLALLFIKLSC